MGSRRLRRLHPAAALVALLGLAACSAGVPQTGEVVSVSPVTTTRTPADAEVLPEVSGPQSGQSESDVAVGYMNAMNTGDIGKIQRWVMPEARDRVARWSDPATTVRVYSVFELGQPYVREDQRRIVPVRVRLVGQLRDGRDWYPATGDDVISLELGRDGADARVANPGLGKWMRDVNFSRLYTPPEVFMATDLADPTPHLAPVPVFVPRSAGRGPEAPEGGVERALGLLLAGPQGRYGKLKTAIPSGTRLQGFRYANGVATVDLTRAFAHPDGSGQLRVGQVVWTVNRLLPSATVRLLVGGRPVRSVGSDQFPVLRHWARKDVPLASMWPQRSQERQDDAILFVRRGEIYTVAPETGRTPAPVELDAPSPKSAPTWSPDRRSMAFLAGSGTGQSLWVVESLGSKPYPAEGLSGRLSPPSWSPDSKRVYVVRRDEAGARLLEVTRNNLSVRSLGFPPLPFGLQPSSIAVSPDGAFVLAVADQPDRKLQEAEPVPGGQLFVGQLGPDGVLSWSERQIAPGLGRVYSPVWVDAVTVAFIAETNNKDDLGKLWTLKSDGWDPTAVLNESDVPIGDIGNHLAVDPVGRAFVVTARSSSGASLWMINRQEKTVNSLTFPAPNAFDSDPSFASR